MQALQVFHNLRKTGLEFIKDIPWGTHICGFYQTKKDLINMAVPYFRKGLENNEYCMWVVSDPLSVVEAEQSLKEAIPNFLLRNKYIEVLSHTEWYLKYGDFDSDQVMKGWIDKIKLSRSKGYEGIRICGNTTWLDKRYWKAFMDYEAIVEREIGALNMIALCTYQLSNCGIHEVIDIVNNHQFSFIQSEYDWSNTGEIVKFDKINMVGKLAASIAHEIRNPMTSIRGFLQLLQEKNEFKSYNDYFHLMIDELDRVNKIITEYLALAKNKNTRFQKENLNHIIRALFPLMQADAVKEDKAVVLDMEDIVDLLIDPNDIRQVILNITRNGLEAMSDGGILNIRTYMENNAVVLEIRDTGTGIPDHVIHSLGTPFLTTKENGTGLGLSVCYSILDRHHATLHIESSKSGTAFFIRFPTLQEE
ncbi:MEDS domain-containing protein [Candidatus Formimonas warabiya]|uniref:histidine kinase n=1 Tax=Formimonas warabiya TaxID=1761012 RepID=A0A3G1KPQ5_FORW1|nr:MEDS domain-containing protein [Candidatus Formimonas warabiya]ATW24441.1 hypothetical protein DCMF_06285 [Candidatus Formimonas warabiya]